MPETESAARRAEIVELLKGLSPRDRRELGIGAIPTAAQLSGTKFSAALEAVPEDEIDGVVAALDEGLEASKTGGNALEPLRLVNPGLAAAAALNAGRRGKQEIHSVQVARRWFEENHPATEVEGETDEAAAGDGEAPAKRRKRRRR